MSGPDGRVRRSWTCRLALVVAVGLAGASLAPGAAGASPAQEVTTATTITAKVSVASIRVGWPAYVTGRVDPPGTVSQVIVQRRVGGSWLDRASSGPLPADGTFKIQITPSEVGTYTMRVRSSGGSIVSPTFTLTVVPKPTISATLSQSSIAVGQPLILSGYVKPRDVTPRVVSQRWVGGRWVDRGAATVNPSNGAYAITITPSELTSYTLRVRSDRGSVLSPVLHLGVFAYVNNMTDTGDARPGEKVISLTFDDGPNASYTPALLDLLAKYKVKATFAVVGYEVEDHPELVKRLVKEGHHVANHTWDHPILTKLSDAAVRSQIARTQNAIIAAGAPAPRCVRPPYGSQNSRIQSIIADYGGDATLMWDVNPDDYTRPGASVIEARVWAGVHPGAIIGLHDGGGNRTQTIAAMNAVIPRILQAGYKIRPVC